MTPEQTIFVGILASAITFILRLLATYANIRVGRLVVNIVLYLVAAGVAVAWAQPALPPFGEDVAAFIVALFELAAPVVGVATLVYNALYKQVVVPLQARFAKRL